MSRRPEDIYYNPDTGYPETRREREGRLREENKRSAPSETAGPGPIPERPPITAGQIIRALRTADIQRQRTGKADSIVIDGRSYTEEELERILQNWGINNIWE